MIALSGCADNIRRLESNLDYEVIKATFNQLYSDLDTKINTICISLEGKLNSLDITEEFNDVKNSLYRISDLIENRPLIFNKINDEIEQLVSKTNDIYDCTYYQTGFDNISSDVRSIQTNIAAMNDDIYRIKNDISDLLNK